MLQEVLRISAINLVLLPTREYFYSLKGSLSTTGLGPGFKRPVFPPAVPRSPAVITGSNPKSLVVDLLLSVVLFEGTAEKAPCCC